MVQMSADGTNFPIYRLVEKESQDVLLAAEDVQGFFVESDQDEPGLITFVRAHHVHSSRRKTEEAELQVVNHSQEKIGAYYLGRVSLLASESVPVDGAVSEMEYSFFGYTCEYPRAGEIWRRWASRNSIERGEWARYPVEYHESWLHVVQTAWFTARRRATRYGTDETVSIDGARATSRAGLYCELGEAANGPGGYFGSNLDALADCLSSLREAKPLFRVVWSDFSFSRTKLGEEFVASVVAVLEEFGIHVSCG